MKRILLYVLFSFLFHEANAQACSITNPYASVTSLVTNPDGTCNVTFNITLTIALNSGVKWINIDITSPCSYSNSLSLEGYTVGTYTLTPFTGITCNNINCTGIFSTGIIGSIGVSNSSSNNHDQCYSPNVTFPITTGGTLPVRLINFSVTERNEKAHVSWTTATEEGVRQFIIQRKKNTGGFEDMAIVISKAVNGSSNNTLSYTTDINEALGEGIYYYRIITLMNSGEKRYSDVRMLRRISNDISVTLSPQPSKGNLHIALPPNSGTADIDLLDISGRILKQWKNISRGTDISDLKAGVYFVRAKFTDNATCVTQKLIVVN